MTVPAESSTITYVGNGSTVEFSFPYRFLENAHLRVVRTVIATGVETLLVLDSAGANGFTATGAGTPNSGEITVVTAPSAAQRLTIDLGNVPATQEQAYVPNTTLPAQTVEKALDKLTMLVQNIIAGNIGRVLRLILGDTDGSGRYNANGNRIIDLADGIDPADAATVQQIVGAGSGNFIAAGAGAVTRTMQNKARDEVSPEDYGAVGDGVTDDTLAWQKAVDSGAKRVRGRQGAIYLIDGQRTLWSPEDLHRLGLVPPGSASFADGYYCGVRVPAGVQIEGAAFYVTKGADDAKAFHAFAFGDATSTTRSTGNAILNCACEVYEDFGGGSKRPRFFLCQSVDGFVFNGNRMTGFDEDNALIGGYLFDCHDADLSRNKGKYVELGFVTEFCTGVSANDNKFFDCSSLIDVDKACADFTICDNTYNRTAQAGAGTVDGVIEINGIDGLVCTGNVINRSRAGIQYSAKGGVANTWAAALAGTAVATYYPPKNIISRNIITNTDYYAIRVGSQWASYEHDGEAGASNVTVSDTIINAYIQGGVVAGEAAAVLVNECDGFVFDGNIDGSGAHGIYLRTSLEDDYTGAGTWSVTKARIGGMIRNAWFRGFRSEAVNEVVFDGLYVTDCAMSGDSSLVETRSMHVKPAKVRGRLTIEQGASTATIGWVISGGEAGVWDASTFSVLMDSVIVKGDAYDPTDGIRLSAQGSSTASALPIIFRSAIIVDPDTPFFTEDGSRTNDGTPSGVLTPRYIGERVFDATNDVWYIGTGTAANTDWQAY